MDWTCGECSGVDEGKIGERTGGKRRALFSWILIKKDIIRPVTFDKVKKNGTGLF